jgi:glycosyltransferase-like protein
MRPLRIAMLTYSVRPRGGPVHALEVSEALARRGHQVELMALARPRDDFFRAPDVPAHIVRHQPPDAPFDERVQAMLAAYRDGLAKPLADGGFDVVHAQDCLSANAALDLREAGVVPHVIRTVHHVDSFTSPSLVACQDRSILEPDALLCVSEPWVDRLAREFGVRAGLVRNGVDAARHRPPRDAAERRRDRAAIGVEGRLVVLTIGGIEPRKGSLTVLEAFARLRRLVPELEPLLVVAGGATLFDYREEVDRFRARADELGVTAHVRLPGSLSAPEIERLYRAADLLAQPSTKEGFGLVLLEALASDLPVVASDLEVFRTFLEHRRNALLVPVGDAEALADALAHLARDPAERARLRSGGRAVLAKYSWDAAAESHEMAYRALLPSLPHSRPIAPAGTGR